MSDGGRLARLARLGTASIAEALDGVAPGSVRILDPALRPIAEGMAFAGRALAVRCTPGDNLAIHRAIAAARPGDALMVDYGGSLGSGPFGEIMALAAQLRGVVGMAIDGAVRDSAAIAAAGFPVFARGLAIPGTVKRDDGVVGGVVRLGGVEVATGEIVVADRDAVIAFTALLLDPALEAGEARAAREETMKSRLRAGETTLAILGLEAQGARA